MVSTCLIYFFVFFVVVRYSNGQDGDVCTTPDKKQGSCIPIRSCQPMMTALLTVERPLSDTAQKQLEAYLCSEDYKVCCPTSQIVISDGDSTDVDITKHKNYKLLPEDCGYLDIAHIRVINGEDAELSEYPWMSLLSFRGSDNKAEFKCAGSIINNRYILTAAHCLQDRSALLGVRLGEYDISNKEIDCIGSGNDRECNEPIQDVAIEDIISHSNFDSTQFINDIGLLRVKKIEFNEKNIRPVCLPREKKSNFNLTSAQVSGWGRTSFRSGQQSNILQFATLKVVNKSECQNTYHNLTIVDDTRICAGGSAKNNASNACKGDSGGPLQVQETVPGLGPRYVQHGIVSFGVTRCNFPALFTKVDHYMNWILDNMRPDDS
ncbi:phenoloxidase-activating factor 3-like [Diabrotica undecimpunctata]|uniref:phenoloxidase-activating factor 3-like n=1 Tax=Diabrotica undecimpunctata TaxID=50387 RepID=UPI003B641D1E